MISNTTRSSRRKSLAWGTPGDHIRVGKINILFNLRPLYMNSDIAAVRLDRSLVVVDGETGLKARFLET